MFYPLTMATNRRLDGHYYYSEGLFLYLILDIDNILLFFCSTALTVEKTGKNWCGWFEFLLMQIY